LRAATDARGTHPVRVGIAVGLAALALARCVG
jgi:hypothetical protein